MATERKTANEKNVTPEATEAVVMRGCNSKASIKPLRKKSFELIITKSLVRREIEPTLKKNKGNTNGKVDQGNIR